MNRSIVDVTGAVYDVDSRHKDVSRRGLAARNGPLLGRSLQVWPVPLCDLKLQVGELIRAFRIVDTADGSKRCQPRELGKYKVDTKIQISFPRDDLTRHIQRRCHDFDTRRLGLRVVFREEQNHHSTHFLSTVFFGFDRPSLAASYRPSATGHTLKPRHSVCLRSVVTGVSCLLPMLCDPSNECGDQTIGQFRTHDLTKELAYVSTQTQAKCTSTLK